MVNSVTHLLKSENVVLKGQFHLDTVQTASTATNVKNAASPPQANVVETNPEFTIIELTCGCGGKTRIKCEHPGGQSTEETNVNGENENAGEPN